jgi:HK97 family phage portal protein
MPFWEVRLSIFAKIKDMFGEKKIQALASKVDNLTDQLKEQESKNDALKLELKGFYSENVNNEYLNQVFKYINNSISFINFDSVDRVKLMDYYRNNAVVYGIVGTTIGNALAELSEYVELQDSKGGVITSHWAIDLLNRPNDAFTRTKLLKAWGVNRCVVGDAYVFGEKAVGKDKGRVDGLYIIPSQDIVKIESKGVMKPISGYTLNQSSSVNSVLTPENTMRSFEYNPSSENMFGLSPLATAAAYLQIIENSLSRQNTSIKSGGVNNIISPELNEYGAITEMQKANLMEDLNEKHNGNYNLPLSVPVKVQKLGDTPVDLAILDTSKYAINALCFVYGISVDSFLGQAKYENAKEAKKAIYEQAAIPLVKEFLEDLNNFLKIKEGKFKLNTDKIEVLKDSKTVIETYNLAGMSLNEKREYLGFERINEAYADQPMISMGTSFGDPSQLIIDETQGQSI